MLDRLIFTTCIVIVFSYVVIRMNRGAFHLTQSPLQRVAAGCPTAIRDCISQYGALVWSMARRLSRTTADAEDATQEIFLDIWRNAGRFDSSKGSDKVFITVIARRRLIDRLRKVALQPILDALEVLDERRAHFPDVPVTSSLEEEHVVKAFSSLRREHREVLELSLLGGLSQSEIASHLVLPLGTLKSFMRRGLTKLRESAIASGQRQTIHGEPQALVSNPIRSSAHRAKWRTPTTPVTAEPSNSIGVDALFVAEPG